MLLQSNRLRHATSRPVLRELKVFDEIRVVFNALGYHSLTSEGLTINDNPVRRFELAAFL